MKVEMQVVFYPKCTYFTISRISPEMQLQEDWLGTKVKRVTLTLVIYIFWSTPQSELQEDWGGTITGNVY